MFKDKDVFLKEEIPLYNNIAIIGDTEGRLSVELRINPYPLLHWEFESFGKSVRIDNKGLFEGSISGHQFTLENALGSITRFLSIGEQSHRFTLTGSAVSARIGNRDIEPRSIIFFLPNTRCFTIASLGSLDTDTYRVVYRKGMKPDLNDAFLKEARIGRDWECILGDYLGVQLSLTEETSEWLTSKRSVGTHLTLKGVLYHRGDEDPAGQNIKSDDPGPSLNHLDRLCRMLSFANGGYLGPLIVKLLSIPPADYEETTIITAYRTTPVELLGDSWVSVESDLDKYLSCFPVFERMVSGELWNDVYELALIWYFQAIQPNSGQSIRKSWPVIANALGAALELLSVTILENELEEPPKRVPLKKRIESLLQTLGVYSSHDDKRFIQIFSDVRNDATHPRQEGKYSVEERNLSLRYAMLWVEEALLWRMGYQGGYRRRIPGSDRYSFEEPRYDLSTRLPTW